MKAPSESPARPSANLSSWLLWAMFVLVLAMLVQAPASLLKKALPPTLPVQATAWGGTVWNGQVNWSEGGTRGQLAWRLHPLYLFLGRLVADVDSSGDLELHGRLGLRLGGSWTLDDLEGRLPGELLKPVLPAGWSLPGDLQAVRVNLARTGLRQGGWRMAGGSLQWAGGPMSFNVNGQVQSATLPALALNLRLDSDTLVLGLQQAAGGQGLATVRLGPDNMLLTQLRQRLLSFSPDYHGAGSPDDVVVTAKQPL